MDEPLGAIGAIGSVQPALVAKKPAPSSFKSALEQVLTVSTHAQDRLAERGFQFAAGELPGVSRAVDAAAKAGSKTAAVVTNHGILVVSPANRTVITALALNTGEMTMVNRVDTLVFVGRTSDEETPRSGRIEGAQHSSVGGHWSLVDAPSLDGGQGN